MRSCFHCASPVPSDADWSLDWHGAKRYFCCAGCHAIAETLIQNGLDEYYLRRTAPGEKPTDNQDARDLIAAYQSESVRKARIVEANDHFELHLYVEGIRCNACVWLIEKICREFDAVLDCVANAMTHRVVLKLSTDDVIPDILHALKRIGYQPHVLRPEERAPTTAENRALLKRLGVAGLVAMQTMMFAVGLYIGDARDMAIQHEQFLRWISALLATMVVFYSAIPFFQGAWRNLIHRRLGMDVPVALAIGCAWFVSIINTVSGKGEVYFDSVTMFTFFLLLGRYLLVKTQHKAVESTLPLSDLPDAVKVRGHGWKPIEQIAPNDEIIIPENGVVPADGELISPQARVNESILTGEPWPQKKTAGGQIFAGSRNEGSAFVMRVVTTPDCSYAAQLKALQTQALNCRSRRQTLIDKIAHHFVTAVLVIAGITFIYWWYVNPEHALDAALAVLVVSCPCALSLATPAAQTAALSGASQNGLLIKDADQLESLVKAREWVFDKTGTLTTGLFTIQRFILCTEAFTKQELDHIAVGLQQHSEHPIARAMTNALTTGPYPPVTQVSALPDGNGMQGIYQGRQWTIKTAKTATPDNQLTRIVQLSCNEHKMAEYHLGDQWRPDAQDTLARLKQHGCRLTIMTGDPNANANALAKVFPVDFVLTGLSPEDKQKHLKEVKNETSTPVVMVGDGLNDAPVLALADVSVAFASGALLSRQTAQMLIVSNHMWPLWQLYCFAQKCQQIIRQNIIWALVYNAISIPAAATGQLPPWLAAIGMSTSSLLVVVNALRAKRVTRPSKTS